MLMSEFTSLAHYPAALPPTQCMAGAVHHNAQLLTREEWLSGGCRPVHIDKDAAGKVSLPCSLMHSACSTHLFSSPHTHRCWPSYETDGGRV